MVRLKVLGMRKIEGANIADGWKESHQKNPMMEHKKTTPMYRGG